ncbi:MAG: hypothetical protein PHC88_12220 [Terrimicrobiaceae bacterium]|nr:hypothetical protein [Terrimicrobiaceae bacterium]
MADRDAWEQPLYRFAAVLLRDAGLARTVVCETLDAAAQKPPVHADPERLVMLLFQRVRRRALKVSASAGAPDFRRGELPADAAAVAGQAAPERIETAIQALPEPGRSALLLLLLDAMEADWIAKLLGLGQAELARALHGARLALYHALAAPAPQAAPNPEAAP